MQYLRISWPWCPSTAGYQADRTLQTSHRGLTFAGLRPTHPPTHPPTRECLNKPVTSSNASKILSGTTLTDQGRVFAPSQTEEWVNLGSPPQQLRLESSKNRSSDTVNSFLGKESTCSAACIQSTVGTYCSHQRSMHVLA